MITPAWRIRDAVKGDLPLISQLFAEQGMGQVFTPENIRVAATAENVIYGALRCEQLSDGKWYIRPVVVFDAVRGMGVGKSLVADALRIHDELWLVSEGYAAGFYEALGFQKVGFDQVAPEHAHECEVCEGFATCGAQPYYSGPRTHELTFLGTTSGCGVPAFFCHCKACEAARKDPSLSRGCTGVAIRGRQTILIDTPPDVRHQLIREGISDLDEVFLTHAHFDHLGGFGELEYLVRLYREDVLPFHASPYALREAMAEFHYMDDCFNLDEVGEWETREADGLTFQAIPVDHCPGCYGYLITTPAGTKTFYAPDTAPLKPAVKEALRGVDNLIMDATFFGDTGNYKTHHSAMLTIEEGLELNAGHIYLTHFAPHLCKPEDNAEELLAEHVKQYDGRVIIARDGMKVQL